MPIKSLLKPEIKKWFEKSASSEFYASHLYQYMANQFQRLGLFGVQKYFLNESKEELEHYQKLVDYVNDMSDLLIVPEVKRIDESIKDISNALMMAYDFELKLMKQYQEFYEDAEEAGDCVTSTFLIDFMQLQRKSVGEFGDLISRLNQNPTDVFEFDEYVGDLVK